MTHGIELINVLKCNRNLSTGTLVGEVIRRGEGLLTNSGAIVVRTGQYTGRSPRDKFIVEDRSTKDKVWWSPDNQPLNPDAFARLESKVRAYYQGRELYAQDCYVGADPYYRLPIRIITETAWASLFARSLFIRETDPEKLAAFVPEFTLLHAPNFQAVPEQDGTRSEAFVVANFAAKKILIGGTSYAGEIKKSIFTLMNYLLPQKKILSMHCSANIGEGGDVALFFGLSGTGKTSLSADPKRRLIGDDEHGWGPHGVFNFEGGCYAKVINLSPTAEPVIWDCVHSFGTVLENVVIDPETRAINLDDGSLTLNTRAGYPITLISNAAPDGCGDHPTNIVMLTADAFGVMPPIAKMTSAQAMYHFISGYTAKVAGTERGVSEPKATFSACFGAPFMALRPTVYADLLGRKIARHKVNCWLINTGWTGGPYGQGHRMPIGHTRAMVHAALSGALNTVPMRPDPIFQVLVPESCPEVPGELLTARQTWKNKKAYDAQAVKLAGLFAENFKKFDSYASKEIKAAAPRV
ncbi:MAG: phosphoenolpyruvate carboxykinase (ATP) [Myxococcales bacterium]|nr:phosphoenolpyruvate carboxykinase (ATP) [Myxococcales bacterium]